MRRVVVNMSINKIRAARMMDSIDNESYEVPFVDLGFDNLNAKELLALLDKLPVGYRTVFNLYAIEGYSHKEIGEVMGIDEGTSRSQLAKSRKALQEMIEKLEKVRL
jgi:RNA polymerase sigma-70 factor (ECF subfamily)